MSTIALPLVLAFGLAAIATARSVRGHAGGADAPDAPNAPNAFDDDMENASPGNTGENAPPAAHAVVPHPPVRTALAPISMNTQDVPPPQPAPAPAPPPHPALVQQRAAQIAANAARLRALGLEGGVQAILGHPPPDNSDDGNGDEHAMDDDDA